MANWIKETRGYGKYAREVPKKISDKKAEILRSEGKTVYTSYDRAKEEC